MLATWCFFSAICCKTECFPLGMLWKSFQPAPGSSSACGLSSQLGRSWDGHLGSDRTVTVSARTILDQTSQPEAGTRKQTSTASALLKSTSEQTMQLRRCRKETLRKKGCVRRCGNQYYHSAGFRKQTARSSRKKGHVGK